MKYEDHAAEIEVALSAISHAIGKGDSKKTKEIAELKSLILADVKRIGESNTAFHAKFGDADCTYEITWGCATVDPGPGVAPMQAPHTHPQLGAAPAKAGKAKAGKAKSRILVGWGGGHCWHIGRCWVCIDWTCRP